MAKSTYSIGVVTYHARFDTYFVPLIKNLARIFPDKEILCVINGHKDRSLQIKYLDKVTRFLKQFPNVRYLTYDEGQSLSKCWNQLIILSHAEKTLILNDDTDMSDYFREQLENNIDNYEFFTINHSFSHFVISKNTVKKVGWFEERLVHVGWEDTDYRFRLHMAGIPQENVKILASFNLHTHTDESFWANDPGKPKTKYSYENENFFKSKWLTKHYNPEIKEFKYAGVDDYNTFSPKADGSTPMFYDLSVLDVGTDANTSQAGNKKSPAYILKKLGYILLDKIFTLLRKAKRVLKKIRRVGPLAP
jgi:hypothetical protein